MDSVSHGEVESNRSFLILIAGLLLAIVLGTYSYLDKFDRVSVMVSTQQEINDQLSRTASVLKNSIDASERQTRFLIGTPPLQGIVRATRHNGIDPLDQTPLSLWLERLQKIAVALIENNPDVLQIRYIGLADDGREILKVGRERGNVRVAHERSLRSLENETYFRDWLDLKEGEVHISGIELHRDYGEIVFPYVPTYRVSSALFDDAGAMSGMLVINFDGKRLLDKVRSRVDANLSVYVISHEYEFVVHPETTAEFTLQLGIEGSVAERFSTNGLSTTHELQESTSMAEPMYFSDQKVWLSRVDTGRYLDVVAAIPVSEVEGVASQRMFVFLLLVGLLVIVVVSVIAFYQRQMARQFVHSVTEAQFKAIVSGSQDAIVSVNSKFNITSWNPAANRLLHYDANVTIGKPLFQFLNLTDDSQLNETTLRSIQDSYLHQVIEITILGRSGAPVDLAVSLSPIESSGQSTGITLLLRDISQEKRAAEEIQRLNASLESQVEARTADLEIARNEALQASEMKSAFLANMSHEIRTPMNGIFGMLNLIKRGPLLDGQARYLALAESSVETLSSLINDILDLSKVEAGRLELEAVEFDLVDLLGSQISSLSLNAQEKGLEVLLDFSGVEWSTVIGDPYRFKQVMTNLMGNAIKFTQRGEILVTARTFLTAEGEVQITCAISDTGDGIPKDKAENLFDAFSQVDSSTTRKYGGTGLGLSISRLLVEQMNGSISVESEVGVGSTFTINMRLPAGNSEPVLEQHKPLIEGKKVLVLAKNLNLMANTRRLLRGWKAHVDTTESIDEVILRVSEKSLDILIIDQQAFALSLHQKLKEEALSLKSLVWLKVVLLVPQSEGDHELDLEGLNTSSVIKLVKPVSPLEYGVMLERFYKGNSPVDVSSTEERELLEQSIDQQLEKFSGARLLLVDDVNINREVAMGLLQSFDLEYVQAENGLEAIDYLNGTVVDLILMDCQMPEMDGFMATRKIREGAVGNRNAKVPIVAMTAGAMAGDRDACLAAGMNDYICKPIDSLEFKQKVLHWLQSTKGFAGPSPTSRAPIITLDDIDSAPDLNAAAAIARMGNNEEIFYKMVDMYVEDTPSKLRGLSTALQEEELDTARHLGHALKGTSASIGAEKMQKLCQQIEVAAEQKNLAVVSRAVLRLRDVYPSVLRSLEAHSRGQ